MNVTWEDAPQPEGVCSRCAADLAERRCNLPGCTAAAVVCAMARGQHDREAHRERRGGGLSHGRAEHLDLARQAVEELRGVRAAAQTR
jgi:hypothetical protein